MSSDASVILERLAGGDPSATAELMPLVYEELRTLAKSKLRREPRGATLQPTALVHEVFLCMVEQSRVNWKGRAHFLAIAATMMRRIVTERARNRNSLKRGGKWRRLTLGEEVALTPNRNELDILGLNEALDQLANLSSRAAQVVELRVYAGMTIDETAEALGVSSRAVDEEWAMAKTWLKRELSRGDAV